jgi:NitT/TauT family transport system permease protein
MEQRWGLPIVAWPARLKPTLWDLLALPLVLGLLALLAWGGAQMSTPYQFGEPLPISLDPWVLPEYAVRTVLRMVMALAASLVFSFAYAGIAAKSRQAEKLLIPALDVLQSVPILGFLSITVTGFIALFPGSLLGVECAAIFAIFTSQAWNMTFSVFQSFRTLPGELVEASRMYHLSQWGRFWRLEVPHAMPNLVWNMMMSVSGGWFFVVASEAITVSEHSIKLPGIGSYIATAIENGDLTAIFYAVLAMFIVIVLYDQLLFRPLLAWSRKFRVEELSEEEPERPWFLIMVQRARIFDVASVALRRGFRLASRLAPPLPRFGLIGRELDWEPPLWLERAWDVVLVAASLGALVWLVLFIRTGVGWSEVGAVVLYGAITATRVLVLIVLASLFWVPIGVWIGLRPHISDRAQAIVQFLAAFPANLFFPIAAFLIKAYDLDVEIWSSPLMILGTQWYILFNVIGGAAALPGDLHYAANNLGVKGWLWWRRVVLPGIFPAYITGAVTAAGGSWNASIVAEVIKWKGETYQATGVGAYIAQWTEAGDSQRIALGITVLCLYVILFNRLLWRRLYDLAAERLRMD